jgi:hypothetical protein
MAGKPNKRSDRHRAAESVVLTALATATCRGPNGNAPPLALYYSRPITIQP